MLPSDVILFRVITDAAFNHSLLRCAAFNHSVCVIRCWSAACYNTLRVLGAHLPPLLHWLCLYVDLSNGFFRAFPCVELSEILCAARCTLLYSIMYFAFPRVDLWMWCCVSRSRTSIHHASILPDVLSVSTGSALYPSAWSPAVCHQSSEVTLLCGMMYLCILIPWSYQMMFSAM
jgi:hypothetical protein